MIGPHEKRAQADQRALPSTLTRRRRRDAHGPTRPTPHTEQRKRKKTVTVLPLLLNLETLRHVYIVFQLDLAIFGLGIYTVGRVVEFLL